MPEPAQPGPQERDHRRDTDLPPDYSPAAQDISSAAQALLPPRYRPRERVATTEEAYERLATGASYLLRNYVRIVDAVNRKVGLAAMYLLFAMMAVLTYAVVSNVILKSPAIWVMEMAQFTMAAYYLLGGGFTLQEGAHVRMDVLYERWGKRTKAVVDSITDLLLLFYLGVVLHGAFSSTQYALEYGQKNYTAWGPPMAPIKIVMTAGCLLMLLQAVAFFIRDVTAALGKKLS